MTTGVFADEKSDAILGALGGKVAGWGDYRVEFSVGIDGQSVTGTYEVSGDAYRVTTPDIVVFCDGATKYEVNLPMAEVVIDNVDPADRTVMGNPTRLFDFFDETYTRRYVGPAVIGGVNCDRISVTETSGGKAGNIEGGQSTDVYISAATGLPVRITYKMGLLDIDAVIDVVKITPRITIDRAAFAFDAGRYTGFEIIDFR